MLLFHIYEIMNYLTALPKELRDELEYYCMGQDHIKFFEDLFDVNFWLLYINFHFKNFWTK